jgi:hypothetical protein
VPKNLVFIYNTDVCTVIRGLLEKHTKFVNGIPNKALHKGFNGSVGQFSLTLPRKTRILTVL